MNANLIPSSPSRFAASWLAAAIRNLIAAGCFASLVGTSATLLLGAPQTSRKPQFRVVSLNIRFDNPNDKQDAWKHRKDDVAKFLLTQKPDIIGLQEVLPNQLDDLSKALDGYEGYGVGREKDPNRGERTPLFFNKKAFACTERGTFWLSKTPDQAGSKDWDSSLPRIASWMKLTHLESGRKLLACNTHFDHRGKSARQESASLLVKQLAKLADGRSVVLTGDFNCDSDSKPYSILTQGQRDRFSFRDAREICRSSPQGPNSTWCGFRKVADGRRIDFVFVSPTLRVDSHEISTARTAKGRFLSDHLPVIATVEFITEKGKSNSPKESRSQIGDAPSRRPKPVNATDKAP